MERGVEGVGPHWKAHHGGRLQEVLKLLFFCLPFRGFFGSVHTLFLVILPAAIMATIRTSCSPKNLCLTTPCNNLGFLRASVLTQTYSFIHRVRYQIMHDLLIAATAEAPVDVKNRYVLSCVSAKLNIFFLLFRCRIKAQFLLSPLP